MKRMGSRLARHHLESVLEMMDEHQRETGAALSREQEAALVQLQKGVLDLKAQGAQLASEADAAVRRGACRAQRRVLGFCCFVTTGFSA